MKVASPGPSPNRHAWRARCLGEGKPSLAQVKGAELLHFVEPEAEG